MNLEQIQKIIKKALRKEETNRKLWIRIKQEYPQLAKEIDFHILETKCFGGDSDCKWEDFK